METLQTPSFIGDQHAITPGALQSLTAVGATPEILLARHYACDWSEMDSFDAAENRLALDSGRRVFSAYKIAEIKYWVITEADRSLTTILLPSEY